MGDNNDHLEQVRRFILKNGFQEPIIISCELKTGNAYITEGNHCLWVATRKGEMTKRGALLHGVPYGVPKMEYP